MTIKDQYIKEIVAGNRKMTSAMVGIKGALEKINDNNILHCQVLTNNTEALRILSEKNKAADWTIKTIIILLLLAIIVLAGAKQAVELFPSIFGIVK